MQTPVVNQIGTSSFTAYKPGFDIPRKMYAEILETPAVKKFGKEYNATLNKVTFFSRENETIEKLALHVDEIKPKNFFIKVRDFFANKKYDTVQLRTNAVNDDEFVKEIAKAAPDTLSKLQTIKF